MFTILEVTFLGIGYLLLGIFITLERALRKTYSAKSLHAGPSDRRSTSIVGVAFGLCMILPLLLVVFPVGLLPVYLPYGFIGIGTMLLGLGLRVWAAHTLGKYYTRTLLTSEVQKVVSDGPYTLIRHPGYLGDIVMWTGFAVLSSNAILIIFYPAFFVSIYLYRIGVEEKMLAEELGNDYREYQRRTKKLLPLFY